MQFSKLSEYLDRLEKTSSRLEITSILAELFKKADSSEIDKICHLLLGQLSPSYVGVVLNIAEKTMLKVIARTYGKSEEEVKSQYKKTGDLGDTAFLFTKLKKTKDKNFNVADVFERLIKIAEEEGPDSQERKIDAFVKLLSDLDGLSAKFVSRIPVGKLRLGFSDKTILDALSWMEAGDKSKKAKLDSAFQVIPDVGLLAKKVKEKGIDTACRNVAPVIGVPVLPMLAQRLKSPRDMIDKMGKVFVEPKFDGLRVQIHIKKPEAVRAFTRNLNNISEMFPELGRVSQHLNAWEVILDSEAIGMDPEMMKIADFQTTMQRRRKYDIGEKAKKIPLRFQVFDVLEKDGKNLMSFPYYQRREILNKLVKPNNLLVVDDAWETDNPELITQKHKEMLAQGLEGVVVKKYDTYYIPGRTGWRWVKMKEIESSTSGKLADTVDCVVMGYSTGKGKRAGFGVGQFLAGIRRGEKILSITKVGTGITDEKFRMLNTLLKSLTVDKKPEEYLDVSKTLIPDYWVKPRVVVELAADEITKSPTHSSGFALRFPRLIKLREDKSPGQATSIPEIEKLFDLQRS